MAIESFDDVFVSVKYTFFRQRYVPNAPGVYLIWVDGVVEFTDETENLRTRYVTHFNEREDERLRSLMETAAQTSFSFRVIEDPTQRASAKSHTIGRLLTDRARKT